MNTRILISKLILLIFRTRQLGMDDHDDLIRTIIGTIKLDTREEKFLGSNNTSKLIDYILNLLEEKEEIHLETLVPALSIFLENDPKLLTIIKDSIEADQEEGVVKRVIGSIVKGLNNHYKEHLAIDVISKMSYDLKFNRSKIGNFGTYLQNAMAELEPLASIQTARDPAIVNELDFAVEESVNEVFEEVIVSSDNTKVMSLGWQAFDRMLQGGIRRGEFLTIGALQHNYKSSAVNSFLSNICTFSKPIMNKEEVELKKKPLILFISLEDDLSSRLQFLYQYLKAQDGVKVSPNDIKATPIDEMSRYVMTKLTANGFHVKMLRVDPNGWGYIDVFNKVIEQESNGYSVHVLFIDYLGKLPTTGCTQGPAGTDFRDLLRRCRNFCSARSIALISPLQLSTEANNLLRNGVPDHQFVKEIANRNYFAGSKQVSQEADVEVHLNIARRNGKAYLTVSRGKHRIPTMVENEEDLYFMLPFPDRKTPILPDLHTDDISLQRIPRGSDGGDQTDLLSEVLG